MSPSPIMLALPGILRGAGCEVVEYDGWRDRGRPYSFTPRGVILHHDGSPAGPAKPPETYARFLFEIGRPGEGIPAPLCQVWIDYYGRWWIGAAGRANHAGLGTGWGVFPRDAGNQYGLGVEMDNTSSEPTTPDQYEALHLGLPVIFAANGWDPANALGSHKEYAPGRKFDPDDIDMPALRSYVAAALKDGGDWFDMATQTDLENAVRKVLDEGKGYGQKSWATTSAATLQVVQGLTNDVAAVDAKVAPSMSVIKLAEHPAQWLVSGGVRIWIKDQSDLDELGLKTSDYQTVDANDSRWSYPAVGEIPEGYPQVPQP